MGLMPILPKHYWEKRDFEATTLDPIVGSGPYVIAEIKPGESIRLSQESRTTGARTFRSTAACGISTRSASTISATTTAAFEAFKKGLADIRVEADPGRWSTAYDFPAVAEGKVIRETVEQKKPGRDHGLCLQHAPADLRRCARAPRAGRGLRFRMGERQSPLQPLSPHPGLLFGIGTFLSRPSCRCSANWRCSAPTRTRILPAILDGTYELPKTDGSGRDRKVLRRAVTLSQGGGLGDRRTAASSMRDGRAFCLHASPSSPRSRRRSRSIISARCARSAST